MSSFRTGPVTVEVLDGQHAIEVVPPSQWHGDRQERPAHAVLADLKAGDGLRAQVSLVRWDDSDEVSLGFVELLAGPSDYERLEDGGAISPKLVRDKLVARIRALRYERGGRATGAAVEWSRIGEWAGGDAQALLAGFGATRTGVYGVLLPSATRFKTEPAIEVPLGDPSALFAVVRADVRRADYDRVRQRVSGRTERMSEVDVSIAMLEDETPGELIKGYFTSMRAFGWDLYVTSHFALRESLGSQWFAARSSELKDYDPKNWRPNHRFEPQDPGVILRDFVHEHDSPYLAVFGGQFQKQVAAKQIIATRNTWFHFGDDPTTTQLLEAGKVVRGFVQSTGMHSAGRIGALIERLDDLRTGRYPTDPVPSLGGTVPVVGETTPLDTPDDLPRPSIGGTRVGTIPELRYRMTRAGDVVHPDTMESVRSRVTGDSAEKVRAGTAVEPRGRELWIDTDGALGGFIGATPRLLGYLWPDPKSDISRGFFTPHFYTVEGEEIADLDSGERRKQPFARGSCRRRDASGDDLRRCPGYQGRRGAGRDCHAKRVVSGAPRMRME